MSDCLIRPFTVEDRPWMLRVITNLQEFERAQHDTRLPGPDIAQPYLALLERRVQEQNGMIALAQADETPVGFTAACVAEDNWIAETADSNRYGYISDIYLDARWRGRGIAQELLHAAEHHLVQFDLVRLRIAALASNHGALDAYRRYGFDPYEVHFEKKIFRRS